MSNGVTTGRNIRVGLALFCVLGFSPQVVAETLRVPHGTGVYAELQQLVTSRQKDFQEGDIVRAQVWRDVVVDGRTVISAGTPMRVRISLLKKRKVAGIKGKLELEAVSVVAVDGNEIMLDGGYDKQGKSRVGLAASLGAVVAWPLIFIRGKNAELEPGTIFDCAVQAESQVEVPTGTPTKIKLNFEQGLTVEVLYDEMNEDGSTPNLPLKLINCRQAIEDAQVTTVNGTPIETIPVQLTANNVADDCTPRLGEVNLKKLGEHFRKGINRFEITSGDEAVEIVLDVEL